jgi:pimeloyl-ACP methyl ester carboxylesterase
VAQGRLDLDREVEALRAVLVAAGGRAVLCGHSSGCAISLYAAAQGLPVDGLVLWEAPLAAPADHVADWVDGLESRIDDGELEAAQEWYMKDMPPEWLAGAKASPAWPAIYAGVVSLRADGQALRWASAGLASGDLRGQVGVPVLSVYGSSTFPEMVTAAERIGSVLRQTEVREVPGAHHVWEPAGFAPVLAGFARSAAEGRQASA